MICIISQRREKNRHGAFLDVLETDYVEYFEKFGVSLVPVSNESGRVGKIFSELGVHGVILGGGNNVDARLFGETPVDPEQVAPERDETEKRLVEEALKRNLPVFGICRGLQFLNVFFGGKISQSIREKHGSHVAQNHEVEIVDTGFAKRLGENKIIANSFHDQGVPRDSLAKELKPFAVAGQIVEGLYHPSKPVFAVQWHPERKSPCEKADELLVKIFLEKNFFWLEKKRRK